MEFNPFDYDFHRDPYPTYAWLREEAPAYHNEQLDFWALSRFDDVLAGLHDPATYTSSKGVALEDEGPQGAAGSMIHMDPPQHTAMRKFIARRFTPRRVAELEPIIRAWARELVERLDGREQFDVVTDFAARLPATVIATMLGIPPEEHEHVREWTDSYLFREEGAPNIPEASKTAEGNLVALSAAIAAARRAHPTDDILSLLVDRRGRRSAAHRRPDHRLLPVADRRRTRDHGQAHRQRCAPVRRPSRSAVGRVRGARADDASRRGAPALHQPHPVHDPDHDVPGRAVRAT